MENKIIIDWISLTFKNKRYDKDGNFVDKFDYRDVIQFLGLEKVPFEHGSGAKGFKERLYFNGISILYDSDKFDYMWVEISGQGCRAFESLSLNNDYHQLFKCILQNSDIINITRLDVAYDDFIGLLDIYAIARDIIPDISDTTNYNFVSPLRSHGVNVTDKGICCNVGSPRSEIMFRIYDKAAERNKSDDIPHWVRCEIQLRRARALEFIRLMEEDHITIEHLYFLVLNNYLRFVKPGSDSNKSRWEIADHWVKFCYSLTNDKMSLFVKPGLDYNLAKLDNVVENKFAGAIYTYIKCHDIARLDTLISRKFMRDKLNPKYQRLLDEQTAIREKYEEEHPDEIFDHSLMAYLTDEYHY